MQEATWSGSDSRQIEFHAAKIAKLLLKLTKRTTAHLREIVAADM